MKVTSRTKLTLTWNCHCQLVVARTRFSKAALAMIMGRLTLLTLSTLVFKEGGSPGASCVRG